ncbi:NlpC/P60 family protein [Arthrobacter globiformis]|uniref:NlpC/P60 family protein n=1 Tax=Arthrobacter globiformis TaxID=1665 RepID=UPI0027890BCB|nr:NlpC/P60 family protein [Arthrobacter globiformis]MDQ0862875.1 cell wall-associated NlpC family hydrolase [Arthrobacter globiformis]
MSFRFISGRRAAAARSNPFTRIASANSGLGRQAAVILAASGLAFTGTVAANAGGAAPAQPAQAPAAAPEAASQVQAPLNAASSVKIEFERTAVESTPAPVVAAPVVEKPVAKKAAAPAAAPVAAPAKAAAAPAAAPKVTVKAAAPAPKAPVQAAAGVNATMLASAYAQIGITQDCTAMVEKALGAAGIHVGDLAPMQFLSHGKVVSTPQPGDMVVQSGHVAIYAGAGKVISGGMNGINATMAHPLSWLTATGPVTFVRAA